VIVAADKETRGCPSTRWARRDPTVAAGKDTLRREASAVTGAALNHPVRALHEHLPFSELHRVDGRAHLMAFSLFERSPFLLGLNRSSRRGVGNLRSPTTDVVEQGIVIALDSP
jgi:hypothetical protein